MRMITLPGLTLFFLVACGSEPPDRSSAPLPVAARYQLETVRLDLASQNTYYLELNISQSVLQLCHSNVVIASYPVRSITLARPTLLFFSRTGDRRWVLHPFTNGRLMPEPLLDRPQIIPDETAGDQSTVPARSLSEIIAVPAQYELVFDPKLRLEVDLLSPVPGKQASSGRESRFWENFFTGLGVRSGEETVIRLEMEGRFGAALFRSFPPSPALLIVP